MKRLMYGTGIALLLYVLAPFVVVAQSVGLGQFSRIFLTDLSTRVELRWGSGDPEGNSTAPPGSYYFRTNGLIYRKTGSTSTGWKDIASLANMTSGTSNSAMAMTDSSGVPSWTTGVQPILTGSGTPEGSVTATVGRLYMNTATGLIYRKQSGSGNTDWSYPISDIRSIVTSTSNSAMAMTDGSGLATWTTSVEPVFTGSGSPQGVLTADRGRLYRDTATGRLYVNDGPSGNTTWRLNAPSFIDLDIQAWQAVDHNTPQYTFTNTRAQMTATGTTNATQSGGNFFITQTSAATTGQIADITPSYYSITNVSTNPDFQIVLHTPASVANLRLWVGLISAAQTDSDTMTGHGAMLRYSTVAGDAGWVPVTRNGSSQTVGTALTSTPTTSTVYRMRIRTIDAGVTWRFSVNGGTETTQTGTVPATNLGWTLFVSTRENVGKRIGFARALLMRGSPVS